MTEKIIQLSEGWVEIKEKVVIPMERFLDEDNKTKKKLFNNSEFSVAYTLCYNMCTQKSPYNFSEQLYQRHGESIAEYLKSKVLPELKRKHDEFLIRDFVKRCANHDIMNRWFKDLFMYIDRFHVKYMQVPPLQEAGLIKFKTIVFDEIKKEVTSAVLVQINSERDGVSVDRDLLKDCIHRYVAMGLNSTAAYEHDFEDQFLEVTRLYYESKARIWTVEESTPSYLQRVEAILDSERNRVAAYLLPSSEPKLLQTIDKELLQSKQSLLLERDTGIKNMLINDSLQDLQRVFKLFSRVTGGLEAVAEAFRVHIVDIGSEKIEQRVARLEDAEATKEREKAAAAVSDKKAPAAEKETVSAGDDPQFVKDMINVHDKYLKMVNEQFHSHSLFQKALNDAFSQLINQDPNVSPLRSDQEAGNGKEKTADLIAAFCDRLLKSGSTEKLDESEIESFLEKTVQLFSYLVDKDVFSELYRNQLAKRLLNQRSASDDMERLLIGKLKLACGAQFTAKLEGMMNDLSVGLESSKAFDSFCKENPEKTGGNKCEFSVQVLTTGHWPQYKTFQDVVLPGTMQRCTQVFREYYDVRTNYRRLTWILSLGTATVKGNFAKKAVEMSLATLQAIVLMAFNLDSIGAVDGPIPFSTLQETTNIPEDVLKKILHSLACAKFKILKKVGDADSKVVKPTDSFQFNPQFVSPMNKIRIPMPSLEDSNTGKRVEEDRSVAIEAAAVRIMKARKTLSHQQLTAEILSQLAFFKPDPKIVKKRIESLIDREYLERDPDNANTYRYLA